MSRPFRAFRCLIFAFVLLALSAAPALADSAPPPPPAGSLQPGEEQTQVRMVSETVTLKIAEQSKYAHGHALVTASFNMRNLGSAVEKMEARFPLQTIMDTGPNQFECMDFGFPPIDDLAVKVDGLPAAIRTEMVTVRNMHRAKPEDPEQVDEPCWGHFWVTFPPGQAVKIDVTYTTQGGEGKYSPYFAYQPYYYLLQTGAGWKDTIGTADIIVQAPFELTPENLYAAYPEGEGNRQIQGSEVRWRFTNLEPTPGGNIAVTIMEPARWQAIQQARAQVKADPQNAAAWASLAYADHQAILLGGQFEPIPEDYPLMGGLRDDAGGKALLKECQDAYQKAIALNPKDIHLRLQYARLTWNQGYGTTGDPAVLNQVAKQSMQQIQAALQVDPNDAQARMMKDYIMKLPGVDLGLPTSTAAPEPSQAPTELRPTETLSALPTATTVVGTPTLSPAQNAAASTAAAKPTDVYLETKTTAWFNGWLWVGLVVVVIGVVVIGLGVRSRGGQ